MSLKPMALIRHSLVACIMLASLQVSAAETITRFESALAKVQRYQSQNEIWQQGQNISDLNIQQSRIWQNPSLNVEQSGFGSNQEKELSIGIQQPLDLFGERKLKRTIANTANQQLHLQQKLWNAQSQLIVKFAWSQFVLADLEQSIYASQRSVSQTNVDSAQKRYQAGSIALVNYERAQIEAFEIQRLHQQAMLNQQLAQRQLTNLWGDTSSEIQLDSSSIPWPDQSTQTVQNNISEGWLEQLYALNTQQSNHQIENLKVQARPHPTLNVGMTQTQATNEDKNTALVLGVDLPLNIFDRQQYRIPMAQQQQILMNQQQQRELKQQILDIANQMHQLNALRKQLDATTAQIDLAANVQRRTLQGFQAGKLSITDIQQATTQLQNFRLGQLDILKQAWRIALTAEAISLGLSFEDISRSDAYTQLNKKTIEVTQNLINEGAR